MSESNFAPELINMLKKESGKRMLNINNNMLALEKGGNASNAQLTILKREVHTLKGDLRMMGFEKISDAAHRLEDLFGNMINNVSEPDPELINSIFKSLDLIQNAIDKLPEEEIDIESIITNAEIKKSKPENDDAAVLQKESANENNDIDIKQGTGAGKEYDYINIKLIKIDDLINMFSTFPRYTNLFSNIHNDLKEFRNKLEAESINDALRKSLDAIIYKLSHELTFFDISAKRFQNEISKIKLVPLATVFDLFPRLVRDMAQQTNKKINFIIKGKDVELDKSVVEKVKDILIHIISNSVDHGCETTGERIKAGKPPDGTVVLAAYNKGNSVIIEIKDDGHGINIDRVRQKAVEKNLIAQEKAVHLPDKEITAYIFEPGFSTKDLNKYSGRGIGMDVVSTIVKELNGEINVETWQGKGTTFKISLPLLSFFLPTTFIKLGKQAFAVPSAYILTSLRVSWKNIKDKEDAKKYITFNNVDISLVDIYSIFNFRGAKDGENKNILILKYLDEIAAVEVTELFLEKKIVIKKITSLNNKFPVIIGAVLLGNEQAIPVLNIPEMFKLFKEGNAQIFKYRQNEELSHRIWAKNILLVDDSLVTRENEKKILLGHELNVFEAANGKEGLGQLEKQHIDLIVSDIEMPVMDGLEFIKELKKKPEYSTIPIVVVSSYKAYEEKLKAMGVNYFINKFNFRSEALVSILQEENIL